MVVRIEAESPKYGVMRSDARKRKVAVYADYRLSHYDHRKSDARGIRAADARRYPRKRMDRRAERDRNLRFHAGNRCTQSDRHGGDLQLLRSSRDDRNQRLGRHDHIQHCRFRKRCAPITDRALRCYVGNRHLGGRRMVFRDPDKRKPCAHRGNNGCGGCDTRQFFRHKTLPNGERSYSGSCSRHFSALRSDFSRQSLPFSCSATGTV